MKKPISLFLALITILYVCTFPVFSLVSGKYSYIVENGKAVITGYTGISSSVSVPSKLDNYTVFAIGEGAFSGNTTLSSVNLSEGICEVRSRAFKDCTKLEAITIPSTVTRFGEEAIFNTAFYNKEANWIKKTQNTDGSSGGSVIGSGQDTIPWEFIIASKLEYLYLGTVLIKCIVEGSYSVKNTTTVIADGAFSGQTKLKECSVSDKTLTLGARAFQNCTSLSKVWINDNCKIYEDAFLNSGIYNNTANWKGDFLTLGTRAVASKNDCTELVAGDGITFISSGIIGVKDVYIPESVTKIDIEAFNGKSSIIYGYGGTYAQSFADEHGFVFIDLNDILIGDMDFDGELTSNDYAIYRASINCSHKMTKYEYSAGDLNADGTIDAFDVIFLDLLLHDKTATTKGDISGDGTINETDYKLLADFVRCRYFPVGDNFKLRADLNGDGVVDAFDVIYLDLYLNGKVSL